MNYFEHHIGDYAEATAHLTFIEDAAYSRLIRKYYATELPLPADIKAVQRLACARSKRERDAVATVLAEFFVLREDGWHQTTCDEKIAAYREGEPEREIKKANEDARLKRHREERAALFKELNAAGLHAAWNIGMKELRAAAAGLSATAATPQAATAPATPATATQAPVTNNQYIKACSGGSTDSSSATALQVSGARIGGLCQRLRPMGVNASPALFAKPGWAPVLERFDDDFIAAIVEQKRRASPAESFSVAYFLPVLTDIMNNPAKPLTGGIHAERSRVLDELTGRSRAGTGFFTIESEAGFAG